MSRSHFQSQHRSPHHGHVPAISAAPRSRLRLWTTAALGVVALCVTCTASGQTPLNKEPIKPLPTLESLNLNPGKIRLGEKLFKDTRLSKDNTISCASCHLLDKGGANPKKFSIGIRDQTVPVNEPTVFNSGFNFRQYWNGRAATLEQQVDMVVQGERTMNGSWPDIVAKLSADPTLVEEFAALFKDGIQPHNIRSAIADFERSLITPSRFDRYLRGERDAITPEEQRGYRLFKSYGCVACHQGVNIGGNMYQKFGVIGDYFAARGNPAPADLGRFNATKKESDRYVFKVPSLRNVALTAPYFHDGSAQTLEQAVEIMFRYQLGRPAPAQDRESIVRFLHALTGERMEGRQ